MDPVALPLPILDREVVHADPTPEAKRRERPLHDGKVNATRTRRLKAPDRGLRRAGALGKLALRPADDDPGITEQSTERRAQAFTREIDAGRRHGARCSATHLSAPYADLVRSAGSAPMPLPGPRGVLPGPR